MTSDLVGVRFTPELKTKMSSIVTQQGYQSDQEFIREAVRNKIAEVEREQAIHKLKELAGSQTATKATKQELAQLAQTLYS